MSSEQFDKRIKSKLEQVKPPYREQAWKNFKSLLPMPWYVALWKQYGPWLYSTVGTVAIITTSYLYFQESKENQQLHEKITTLQSQVAQPGIKSKQPLAPMPLDTVPVHRPKSVDTPDRSEIQEVPSAHNLEIKENSNTKIRLSPTQTTRKISGLPAQAGDGKILDPTIQIEKGLESPNTDIPNSNITNKSTLPAANPIAADSSVASGSNTTTLNQAKDSVTTPPALKDSMVVQSKTDSMNVTPVSEPEKQIKSNAKVGLVQARLGLHSDFNGFTKVSVGPTLEVFLARNISLNTGLLFGAPEEKRLPFPRDFNMATGRRFEDQYHKHIPRNDRLQGIVVKTSVLRLPIGVNYYIPVNERLSFITLAGTNLNISVYQTVEFKSFFAGEEQLNKFETKSKTQTFNNLYYGVGLQYKFGRLVGQISPYFQSFFREPDYFNQSKKFGFNAALKFNLKK